MKESEITTLKTAREKYSMLISELDEVESEEMKKIITKQIREIEHLREKLQKELKTINSARIHDILFLYFIRCCSVGEIIELHNITPRHFYRILKTGKKMIAGE